MAKILHLSIFALLSLHYIPSFLSEPATSHDDIHQYLETTNMYRSKVNVPPLLWSKTLAEFASNIAGNIISSALAGTHPTPISDYGYFGMNKYVQCHDTVNQPHNAVNAWYSQKDGYDNTANSCIGGRECGAYTQIVWTNSTEFGCSSGVKCVPCGCPKGDEYAYRLLYVCVYNPPGNIPGQRPY